jgi:hypothetical protein
MSTLGLGGGRAPCPSASWATGTSHCWQEWVVSMMNPAANAVATQSKIKVPFFFVPDTGRMLIFLPAAATDISRTAWTAYTTVFLLNQMKKIQSNSWTHNWFWYLKKQKEASTCIWIENWVGCFTMSKCRSHIFFWTSVDHICCFCRTRCLSCPLVWHSWISSGRYWPSATAYRGSRL